MNQTFENCTLLDTKTWFEVAVKHPNNKNLHTQLGVHCEEVSEMIQEITPLTPVAGVLLNQAKIAMTALGDYLKAESHVIMITAENDLMFLDSLCDQIVTGTGVAHMCDFNIVAAMHEVNRSNFSKFDGNGNPIFDENMKIMKDPKNYSKPDLTPYI